MIGDSFKNSDVVFQELQRWGLLLVSDAEFPNVAFTVSQTRRKGSWWSHPDAHTIFAVNNALEDHPDVLVMKLISGKVTFVHRELWKLVYSIGIARENWQIKPLSSDARALLKRVDAEQSLETGVLGKRFDSKPGDAARELEYQLLIHTQQVHTSSGTHAKVLQTWNNWAKGAGFKARAKDPAAARRALENRLRAINPEYPTHRIRFPWPPSV